MPFWVLVYQRVTVGGPGCQHRGCASEAVMVLPSLHPDPLSSQPCTAASATYCRVTHPAVMKPEQVSQWEDEQSYTHEQPQALGCCCQPHVMAPLRRERGYKETLSCRVCCGGDWKELRLAQVCTAPSASVLPLQVARLQSKLWSPTTHNH